MVSNHMQWKAIMINALENLIVLVNPDKFVRPFQPEWSEIAKPIVVDDESPWHKRLEDPRKLTHIITGLPEDPASSQIVGEAMQSLLRGKNRFVLTPTLFHSESEPEARRFITIVDERTRRPLNSDELWVS